MQNLKPAHITVDRDDYNWMIVRFGNNGVRPDAGELTKRERAHVKYLETALDAAKSELEAIKDDKNEKQSTFRKGHNPNE